MQQRANVISRRMVCLVSCMFSSDMLASLIPLSYPLDFLSFLLMLIMHVISSADNIYLKACTLARRTAETFLKYIGKNVNQLGMPLMKTRNPNNNVQGKTTLIHYVL